MTNYWSPGTEDDDGGDAGAGTTMIVSKNRRWKETGVHGGAICGRCPSLNTRDRRTPTPSKTLSRMPQAMADPSADFGPPLNSQYCYIKVRKKSTSGS